MLGVDGTLPGASALPGVLDPPFPPFPSFPRILLRLVSFTPLQKSLQYAGRPAA